MTWIDSSGHLWLFAGEGYDASGLVGYLNDLWQFNPSTNQWTWMNGSSTEGANGGHSGVYGTLGSPAAANVPGARRWASTWNDGNGHLWLFGGGGYDSAGGGGDLNDLWEFNPSTNQWTWMAGSSTVGTVCFVTNLCGRPGVYGTLGASAAGNTPGGRYSPSNWIDNSEVLWLFGGDGFDSAGHQNILNDLWKFQPPIPPAAATPTFSVAAGNYGSAQTVTISDTTSGSTIYYTTNGTTPTTSSAIYTAAITISSSETVEAIATASGYSTSAVATAAYTIGTTAPNVTLSPATLTFATQSEGTTSAPQSITFTNSGTAALSISSIAVSGDFAQTNTCAPTIAVGANCTIAVTFTPTAAGTRSGALTITDNAVGSPQTVALTGGGQDVSLSTASTALAIASAGGSATATIQISPQSGFTGTVNLTCAVTYQGQGTPSSPPTCSLSPAQLQVAGSSAISSTLTISTTAASAAAALERRWNSTGIVLAALLLSVPTRRRWRRGRLIAVLCVAVVGGLIGCSGGSAGGGGSTPQPNPGSTPGNYQVSITASSGTVNSSMTVQLSLQ